MTANTWALIADRGSLFDVKLIKLDGPLYESPSCV